MVGPDLFNGCYTSYGQPCHSLPSLSLSLFLSTFLYYFHSFFFPIQVSSLGSHGSTSFYLMFLSSLFGFCYHVGLNFPAIFLRARPLKRSNWGKEDCSEWIGEDFIFMYVVAIVPLVVIATCYMYSVIVIQRYTCIHVMNSPIIMF